METHWHVAGAYLITPSLVQSLGKGSRWDLRLNSPLTLAQMSAAGIPRSLWLVPSHNKYIFELWFVEHCKAFWTNAPDPIIYILYPVGINLYFVSPSPNAIPLLIWFNDIFFTCRHEHRLNNLSLNTNTSDVTFTIHTILFKKWSDTNSSGYKNRTGFVISWVGTDYPSGALEFTHLF